MIDELVRHDQVDLFRIPNLPRGEQRSFENEMISLKTIRVFTVFIHHKALFALF